MRSEFMIRGPSWRERRHLLAAVLLATSLGPVLASLAYAQEDRYSVQRTAQVASSGVRTIRIENGSGQVSGSLHLGSIGSGSLTADWIGGDLTVDRKGSGSVQYNNVKGRVRLPARRGDW